MEIEFQGKLYSVRSGRDIAASEWEEAAANLELAANHIEDLHPALFAVVLIFAPDCEEYMREWDAHTRLDFCALVIQHITHSITSEEISPNISSIWRYKLAFRAMSETIERLGEQD